MAGNENWIGGAGTTARRGGVIVNGVEYTAKEWDERQERQALIASLARIEALLQKLVEK